mgnify:CR=1 FL=1
MNKIVYILLIMLCTSCAGTYYVHDRPNTIYVKDYNYNWWWWNVNKSTYTNYVIIKPNKPTYNGHRPSWNSNRPNKPNNKPNKNRSKRK